MAEMVNFVMTITTVIMAKMKPYHSIIVFAAFVVSAIATSIHSYNRMQSDIVSDMDQALVLTLHERQDLYLTPDTIQDYRSHLKIEFLRSSSLLCYVVDDRRGEKLAKVKSDNGHPLASKTMMLNSQAIKGYANCSFADVFGMSDQRTPLCLTLMAMLWAVVTTILHRRGMMEKGQRLAGMALIAQGTEEMGYASKVMGALYYSNADDRFYNSANRQAVRFTPMQHKLMRMFFDSKLHQLSKQEICATLWPKKPDASETLYTLIRRIKPIIESNKLIIESERGRAYTLKERREEL